MGVLVGCCALPRLGRSPSGWGAGVRRSRVLLRAFLARAPLPCRFCLWWVVGVCLVCVWCFWVILGYPVGFLLSLCGILCSFVGGGVGWVGLPGVGGSALFLLVLVPGRVPWSRWSACLLLGLACGGSWACLGGLPVVPPVGRFSPAGGGAPGGPCRVGLWRALWFAGVGGVLALRLFSSRGCAVVCRVGVLCSSPPAGSSLLSSSPLLGSCRRGAGAGRVGRSALGCGRGGLGGVRPCGCLLGGLGSWAGGLGFLALFLLGSGVAPFPALVGSRLGRVGAPAGLRSGSGGVRAVARGRVWGLPWSVGPLFSFCWRLLGRLGARSGSRSAGGPFPPLGWPGVRVPSRLLGGVVAPAALWLSLPARSCGRVGAGGCCCGCSCCSGLLSVGRFRRCWRVLFPRFPRWPRGCVVVFRRWPCCRCRCAPRARFCRWPGRLPRPVARFRSCVRRCPLLPRCLPGAGLGAAGPCALRWPRLRRVLVSGGVLWLARRFPPLLPPSAGVPAVSPLSGPLRLPPLSACVACSFPPSARVGSCPSFLARLCLLAPVAVAPVFPVCCALSVRPLLLRGSPGGPLVASVGPRFARGPVPGVSACSSPGLARLPAGPRGSVCAGPCGWGCAGFSLCWGPRGCAVGGDPRVPGAGLCAGGPVPSAGGGASGSGLSLCFGCPVRWSCGLGFSRRACSLSRRLAAAALARPPRRFASARRSWSRLLLRPLPAPPAVLPGSSPAAPLVVRAPRLPGFG